MSSHARIDRCRSSNLALSRSSGKHYISMDGGQGYRNSKMAPYSLEQFGVYSCRLGVN